MPIDLELVLAGRDLTEPLPSPDGRTVAFVAKWSHGAAVMTVPIAGGPERLLSTGPEPAAGRAMGGGCLAWHPDGQRLIYVAVDGELWVQHGALVRRLTSFERTCRAPSVSADGEFVVVVLDEAEVWSIGVDGTAARRLDDGGDAFCFDPAISPCSSTVVWQAWSPPDMPWDGAHGCTRVLDGDVVERWRPDEAAVQQPRFMPDGSTLLVHDASGWLNAYVDGEPVLSESAEHAGPTWGMGQRSVVSSPDGSHLALCRNEAGFGRLVVVDRASGAVTDVGKGEHGQLSWVGDTIVALRSGAVTPTQIVAYDVGDLSTKPPRTLLAVGPPVGWDDIDLPEPVVVEVPGTPAGDAGTTLHARHYVADGTRVLVWVHGGPTDQWRAEWRPRISYWWSRGWDVLVVDPRGTTGHGRWYQQALDGGWGRVDVDDTAALIRHLHTGQRHTGQRHTGIGPADTVVIGGSSGGLTVLGVLADHPELVAGGVASYPVADIAALADTTHRFEAHYGDRLIGETPVDELSPINRAHRIAGPLLLLHGTDDPVVSIDQSRRLADAIRSAGGTVELVEYEGEGHGFRHPDHVRDEYRRMEEFLGSVTASPPRRPG